MTIAETYKFQVYVCGCGYKTGHSSNASKHKKVLCGHIMTHDLKEFVVKDIDDSIIEKDNNQLIERKDVELIERKNIQLTEEIDTQLLIIERKNVIITKKNLLIEELKAANEKIRNSVSRTSHTTFADDTKDEGSGLIYFIMDRDIPDRGKIGRTKITDVKKLKSRYSTFGCPIIFCYLSEDIKKDENTLKKILRNADCMRSNTEMVSNCKLAKQLFDNFVNDAIMSIQ